MPHEIHIHQEIMKEYLLSIMSGSHVLLDVVTEFTIQTLHLSWISRVLHAFLHGFLFAIPVSRIVQIGKSIVAMERSISWLLSHDVSNFNSWAWPVPCLWNSTSGPASLSSSTMEPPWWAPLLLFYNHKLLSRFLQEAQVTHHGLVLIIVNSCVLEFSLCPLQDLLSL